MNYTLTLPAGTISVNRGIFTGSNTQAQWNPCNPIASKYGGWMNGDTLTVVCSLNLNPPINPLPPSTQYAGLCAGACSASNSGAVQDLIDEATYQLPLPTPGALLGNGISTVATNPPTSSIFYNATSTVGTFPLTPITRGTLINYIYEWNMIYNGNNNVVSSGADVEIVFGYGDPMNSEVDS